jgi:hypothetical protein
MRLNHLIAILIILATASPALSQSLFNSEHEVLAQRKKVSKKAKPKKEPVQKEESEEEESEDEEEVSESEEATTTTLQRGNRMEFDARLIRGETAGAGAVFLFQRAPRALPSMVKTRTSYLSETVQDVLGDTGTEQFEKSKVQVMKEIEKEGKARSKDGSK